VNVIFIGMVQRLAVEAPSLGDLAGGIDYLDIEGADESRNRFQLRAPPMGFQNKAVQSHSARSIVGSSPTFLPGKIQDDARAGGLGAPFFGDPIAERHPANRAERKHTESRYKQR
jgi:hypothetical protein